MVDRKDLHFAPFIFIDHEMPNGLLPNMIGAHACWYYCKCAHESLDAVRDGAIIQGEDDHINRLNNIARGIAMMYSLESPDEFLKFMDYCQAEAIRTGKNWDSRVERPGVFTFIKN